MLPPFARESKADPFTNRSEIEFLLEGVGIATSNSFMLPTHQVNALYMGPGRYRSVDFMKAGAMMSILFIVVLITMLYLFYGI